MSSIHFERNKKRLIAVAVEHYMIWRAKIADSKSRVEFLYIDYSRCLSESMCRHFSFLLTWMCAVVCWWFLFCFILFCFVQLILITITLLKTSTMNKIIQFTDNSTCAHVCWQFMFHVRSYSMWILFEWQKYIAASAVAIFDAFALDLPLSSIRIILTNYNENEMENAERMWNKRTASNWIEIRI